MTYGDALEHAKAGRKIRRETWEKGRYIRAAYTCALLPYLVDERHLPYFSGNEDTFADDWELTL